MFRQIVCPKNWSVLQKLIYGQKTFSRTVCYTPLVCKTESTWFFNSLHHHHNESFLMSFAIDDRLLVASTVKENESRISLYFFSWASLSESRTRWRSNFGCNSSDWVSTILLLWVLLHYTTFLWNSILNFDTIFSRYLTISQKVEFCNLNFCA